MRESTTDLNESAAEQTQQPTASQILSKVYKQIVSERRIHRAITNHVRTLNKEKEDEVWKMVIL